MNADTAPVAESKEFGARVARLNAEVAAAYELRRTPSVRLAASAIVAYSEPCWIRGGTRISVQDDPTLSDEALQGLLAHEQGHVSCGDISRRRWLATNAPLLVPSLGGPAVAVVVAVIVNPALLVWAVPLLCVVPLVVLPAALRSRWQERAQTAQQWREVRADLVAARTVGRQPVLTILRHLAATGVDNGQTRLPTHPPVELRIAAVEHYDPNDDPSVVARSVLHDHSTAVM